MTNFSNLFRFIALRHVQQKPSRAILTTLGVAFGISLYVAIAIINHSTRNSMLENIEAVSGKAKLSISAGVAGFQESKLELIRATKGVKFAVPMVESHAFFAGATESADGLEIMGVDLLQESSVRTYKTTDQKIIDDPLTFLNQADSIILTKAIAEQRHLKIDSKLTLSTAQGAKTFTVRGLLEPEGAAKAYGGALAIMDIDGARATFGKENKLDRVDIIPEADISVETVQNNLETTLGPGFLVERPESQSAQTEKLLSAYQMTLTFFSTLALLVGLFLVMNSISIAIAERRKEIGTLRALGATRSSMVFLFVSEVFGVGFLGSALGCVLGKGLAYQLSGQIATSVGAQLQARIRLNNLEFTKEQLLFTLVAGTLSAVVAAFFPALKAAAVHPLESMKKHAGSFSEGDQKRSNVQVSVGFLLLVFASISMMEHWGPLSAALDVMTKIASVLGAALFGPFIVFFLLKQFRKLTSKFSLPILKLSEENLLRSRRRTTSNVMALMVGLFLVVLISSVRSSFHDTLTQWLDQIFVADILVGSNGRFIAADLQPIKEEIQDELLKIPGIKPLGASRGAASRIVPFNFQGTKMAIKAIDHYADFYQYRNFAIQGADRIETAKKLYENDLPRLLATDGFLNHAHKKVGDQVDLDTPSGRVPFEIIGRVTDYASANGVIYLNRQVYRKYWNDHLVSVFVFSLLPGYRFEQVRQSIDLALGKKWNLVTISSLEFKEQMKTAVDRTFAYTRAIEFISLLVGLLGLLNTLLISVMERTREIGMLRAIGSTRTQISWMIVFEAILQGFFGAVVAIILGSYIGKLFIQYSLTTSLGWIVDFHFPTESIFSTLLTGVVVAGIAGFLPARHASRLQITEALDYE